MLQYSLLHFKTSLSRTQATRCSTVGYTLRRLPEVSQFSLDIVKEILSGAFLLEMCRMKELLIRLTTRHVK